MTNFDPNADFSRVADNTEAVTLLRRGDHAGRSGDGDPACPAGARRNRASSPPKTATNRGDISIATDNASRPTSTGTCPRPNCTAPPSIGDAILDGDGRRWTILELELIMLRTRWKCFARELSIAYGLDDTVAVLKAEYAKSDAGAAEPAWQTWRTGIRARIQPLEVKVDVENSARCATSTYRIFVEDDLALDQTHRIRGADGTVFQITAVTGAARLGELQTIEAVKV